jgi:hypothetical protein
MIASSPIEERRMKNKKTIANKRHTTISVRTQKCPDILQLSHVLQKNCGSKKITSYQARNRLPMQKGQKSLEWVQ